MFLPVTPKAKDYYLFSKKDKDSLLEHVESPRIIFVGGSNLVFGLNSNLIKDSLDINPINAGITASVGLIYMMDNTLSRIKYGDIVVIAPEYQQFFGNFAYGGNDLVRLLFDIEFSGIEKLNKKQLINVAKNSPEYFVSKFYPSQYMNVDKNTVYSMNIFNEYGDSQFHWKIPKQDFSPSELFTHEINYSIFDELNNFSKSARNKGASVLITFPCFQSTSYEINRERIKEIEEELRKRKRNYIILGNSERYKFPDSLMFDTPYHLLKKGVDLRTKLLIEDYKQSNLTN